MGGGTNSAHYHNGENMKILIAYDSKTGTARECAEMLAGHFSYHDTELFDLRGGIPRLSDFDFVIIGGSIRFGKLSKNMRAFLREERESIIQADRAFFICCAEADEAEDHIVRGFGEQLLSGAVAAESFGGELRPERHKGIERLFVKMARKSSMKTDEINYPNEIKTPPAILPDRISYFADKIRDSFAEN